MSFSLCANCPPLFALATPHPVIRYPLSRLFAKSLSANSALEAPQERSSLERYGNGDECIDIAVFWLVERVSAHYLLVLEFRGSVA